MKATLNVEVPASLIGQTVPARVGLPWPRSQLFDHSVMQLSTDTAGMLTHQRKVLERWPDGSAKWTLFDVLVPVASASTAVELEIGSEEDSRAGQAPENDPAAILAGELRCSVGKPEQARILSIDVEKTSGGQPFELAASLTDRQGREWQARISSVDVTAQGPVRTSVRVTGAFTRSSRSLPVLFEATLDFFTSVSAIRVEFDIWNPRAAYHPGNIWDLGDPGSFVFGDLSVRLKAKENFRKSFCRAEASGELLEMPSEGWALYQDSSGGENWDSQNHVDANGDLTVSFRGYRISDRQSGGTTQSGDRASPLAAAIVGESAVGVSVSEFWQNFPGAVRVEEDAIEIGLFPGESGNGHELQGGERKRQGFVFAIGDDVEAVVRQCQALESVNVWPDPEWIEESGAVPWFANGTTSTGNKACNDYVNTVVSGPLSFEARREVIDEYGWRNYGDLYADHEAVREQEPGSVITHYNNQYDFVYGAAIHALRGKDQRWWDLMAAAARHHVDIDTYHTSLDRPAYNHGTFWHTEHYRSAGTATHRTYSRANKSGKGFGGGPSNEHNYTSGLAHYHLLTGDESAKRVVLGLADWVIDMDDGAKTIWSVIDPATPTGLASRTVSDAYHGPGRGAGNSINALMDAHALSGDRSYFERAEELIRRCIHPLDDIDSLELDQPEYRWSYLVFLQTLGKYLWRKEELEEIDYPYGYARDSLLHYSRWMLHNERPYADVLDRVELPTETWPAQDIRKAHVLYLAAVNSEENESAPFLDKAEFFYSRCLEDLLQFETAYLCRPRVLLTVYGCVRDYFSPDLAARRRSRPQIHRSYNYGIPQRFIPQRANLGAAMRSRLGAVAKESGRLLPGSLRVLVHRLSARLRGKAGRGE